MSFGPQGTRFAPKQTTISYLYEKIPTKHIFPQVVNSIVVLATLQLATVVLTESVLSFLGAGIPPPTASWGNIVAEGRNYIRVAWWSVLMPGACITLLVLSANLFGDWLRDYLDPKLRQV